MTGILSQTCLLVFFFPYSWDIGDQNCEKIRKLIQLKPTHIFKKLLLKLISEHGGSEIVQQNNNFKKINKFVNLSKRSRNVMTEAFIQSNTFPHVFYIY